MKHHWATMEFTILDGYHTFVGGCSCGAWFESWFGDDASNIGSAAYMNRCPALILTAARHSLTL